MRYRNQAFCPVVERGHLPLDTLRLLDDPLDEAKIVAAVRNTLCNSCASMELDCDPVVCEGELRNAMTWTKENVPEDLPRGMGGCARRVYHRYAKARVAQENRLAKSWRDFNIDLLDT